MKGIKAISQIAEPPCRGVRRTFRRQGGLSILELAVTISMSILIMAPMAVILFQVTAAPVDTTQGQNVVNQIRNVDINIPDDIRSAQTVVTGDEPILSVSTWTDFAGASRKHRSVTYFYASGDTPNCKLELKGCMFRAEIEDGFVKSAVVIGRFLDEFDDIQIGFTGDLPPFLLQTRIQPEVDTPLRTQKRNLTTASFMRAPVADPPQKGGYAIFTTGATKMSGNDNGVIGNVHANGEIGFSCRRDHVTGIAEAAGGISLRPGGCYYLHNYPTPPSCDSPSYRAGYFQLSTAIRDAQGITTDGLSIWVMDKNERKVQKYDLLGNSIDDFHLTNANKDPRGITTDGSFIWVADEDDRVVYKYDLAGNFVTSFNLTSANGDATGITTDGTSLWVADRKDKKVYQYNTTGDLITNYSLTSSNGDPRGITTDATSAWVVDQSDKKVYKYDLGFNFISEFDLTNDNREAEGITTDGTSIWVVDKDDRQVYAYTLAGVFSSPFDFPSTNNDPEGITMDGSSFWVVDKGDKRVYRYDDFGCIVGGFDLDPANSDARGIATDASSIWIVDKSDKKVYKYDASGNRISTGDFALNSANGDARGITEHASFIWVVDKNDRKVYVYTASGLDSGSFGLIADNADPQGITTDGSSIWVVDNKDRKTYSYDISGVSSGDFDLASLDREPAGITTAGSKIWVSDKGTGKEDGDDDDAPKGRRVVFEYEVDGSFASALPMDQVAPTAITLFNYNSNRDSKPGLRIKRSSKGLAETDSVPL